MAYSIRRLRKEELGELATFLRLAYPGIAQKADTGYLAWYFVGNPNIDADPALWVVRSAGRIVGQVAAIPVQLRIGNTDAKAVWILEFILLPEFRGQGLGKKLVQAAGEAFPILITLGINEASTRVFTSLSWKPLGGIHRYHKLLFVGSAARKLGDKRLLRESLNLLSRPLRPFRGSTSFAHKYEVRRDSTFGVEIDDLWERAALQWPVAVRRDHRFLAWQFLHQPGKVFDFIRLYEHGKLVGYAILFFRRGVGSAPPCKAAISDLVYDSKNPDEIIDALLGTALDLAIERRAGSLVTDMLDPRVEMHLQRLGFWRIKNSPRFMASSAEFKEILYRPENWYLTRADSDVSIFEEPNVVEP